MPSNTSPPPDHDATLSSRTVLNTRLMNHSPQQLWNAWTDPKLLAQWWGPNGFTNTFEEFNPQPNGQWRFTMHGPNGENYPQQIVFVEFSPHRCIVLDHVSPPVFRVTATFDPMQEQTQFTFRQEFQSVEICNSLRPICEPANEQIFDRLDALLKAQ